MLRSAIRQTFRGQTRLSKALETRFLASIVAPAAMSTRARKAKAPEDALQEPAVKRARIAPVSTKEAPPSETAAADRTSRSKRSGRGAKKELAGSGDNNGTAVATEEVSGIPVASGPAPHKGQKKRNADASAVTEAEADPVVRCSWARNHDLERVYHDQEWGSVHPAGGYSDELYYEFLVLEAAQAGLSWRTILVKREAYRKAFANFDMREVAAFGAKDVERLLKSEGAPADTIVRNKAKIEAAISAAQLIQSSILKEYPNLHNYFASFYKDGKPVHHAVRATSPESDAVSTDLKRRGFKFCGTTIVHALLQALGWAQEHDPACFKHPNNL
ncbi:Methyladenine glycosylase-domain-containing protein [Hyaloraphidium curvatum]|nr:Methyladenine glycosylase-domain-containing protein [Hyaloraphidium curvatum]